MVLRGENVQFVDVHGGLCQSHERFYFGAYREAFVDFACMAESNFRIVGRYDVHVLHVVAASRFAGYPVFHELEKFIGHENVGIGLYGDAECVKTAPGVEA